MNEFIKKLIERLEERKAYLMKDFVLANVVLSSKQKALDRINELDGAIEIVNQLAEEYNNDVCEWHKVKNGNAYKCNTHAEIHDSRVLDWCICPYCGKKIKVVE